MFRGIDADNYIDRQRALRRVDPELALNAAPGRGTASLSGRNLGVPSADGDEVEVSAPGSELIFKVNGVTIFTGTTSLFPTGTLFGVVGLPRVLACARDNLQFTAL